MMGLHRELNNDEIFVPEEGQRDFLCSNKESLRCPSLGLKATPLPKETLDSLEELGGILKHIHVRMLSKGYRFVNGTITRSLD